MIPAAWDPNLERLDEAVDHVRGPAEGRLIIEYGDYECPYSRLAFRAIERIEQALHEADLQRYADQLGLDVDVARFDDDRQGTGVLERIRRDVERGSGDRQGTRHADAVHRRHPPPRQLRRRDPAERTGGMSNP